MSRQNRGSGALAVHLVDIQTPDEQIEAFLNQTLFEAPTPPELNDEDDATTIQCSVDCCRQDPLHDPLKKLVLRFSDFLSHHKLKPGSLITFSVPDCDDSATCFLGVTLQRPKTQTLMQAELNDGTGSVEFMLEDSGSMPKIFTSARLFKTYLQAYRETAEGLQDESCLKFALNIEVWNYTVQWVDTQKLSASFQSVSLTGNLNVTQARIQKERGKLPFGLKPPRKPPQSKVKPQPQKKRQRTQKQSGAADDPDGANDHDDLAAASSASSGGERPHLHTPLDVDAEAESQKVDPVTDTMVAEEKAAKALEAECKDMDEKKQEVAEQCRTNIPSGKSFFSKFIGLDSIGIAASSRSVCLHCQLKIPKNDIRYAWYHSCLRPHGWVHSYCLVQISRSTKTEARTISKLHEILEGPSGSSGSSMSNFQRAAREVLQVLAPEEAS